MAAGIMLPLGSTSTPRGVERTGYQLQPTSMHVNHHGMLPAAALSNFFKAPSTPIHGKLPSISISGRTPVYRTKSIHQRNKCLAELIQSQLVELKRLQDKYRFQKSEPKMIKLRRKDSVVESGGNLTKSNSSNNLIAKKKDDISGVVAPDVRLIPKTQHLKPTTLTNRPSVIKSTHVQPADARKRLTLDTQTLTAMASRDSPSKTISNQPEAISKDNLRSLQAEENGNHMPINTPNSFMDSSKLASISNWIKSVEIAHRLEGKCSEVISTPSL